MKGFENILTHFTRSYASVANALFENEESEADGSRARARQSVYANSMLSEAQKKEAYARIDKDYAQHLKTAEATLGVVPPALQAAYMTATLLPHQQEGLRIPVKDVRNRYVTYDGDQVHNIEAAMEYLRNNLVGFFVTAPLNWGEGTKVDSGVDQHMSVDIAFQAPPTAKPGREA